MKRFATCLLISVVLLSGCSTSEKPEKIRVNAEYANYIQAYTSGIISREASLRIQLAQDYEGEIDYTKPIKEDLFELIPSVKGKAWWLTKNTIMFVPDNLMPSGQQFEVRFKLSEVMQVPEEFETFAYNFSTVDQDFDTYIDGLSAIRNSDLTKQQLYGRLVTADVVDSSGVRHMLTAKQDGKTLPVDWDLSGSSQYKFHVTGITRGKKASEVVLYWKGLPIGVSRNEEEKIEVPALGDFKVTDMTVTHDPEQYVQVHFSDPLLRNQDLTGLITIGEVTDLTYIIEGQNVRIYLPYRISGPQTVTVSPGVKNVNGYKMINGESIELPFEGLKPDVRLSGNGTIIPNSSKGLYFPFEAVNLRAVDLIVTKVYQNNIIQYLQVSSLQYGEQMKRVSDEVVRKRIDLNTDKLVNLHEWNLFSLDLSEIISVDPGALYQVELRFKKEYSVYNCDGQSIEPLMTTLEQTEDKAWTEDNWTQYDYWYDYDYWDYSYDYDYDERDNPCDHSYYRDKVVKSNVLASNIGLIVKAGTDKEVHVFVNNLQTTAPISSARVQFYSYTQQLLGSVVTDSRGMASIKLEEKPFVAVASSNNQRGYLRLRDGESLSLSKFDVAGETVQRELKGYIYTERGVWRPGDSIYVAFMLEDRFDAIPASHPVSFELIDPKGQLVTTTTTSKNLNGLYDFRTATSEEAPTGNYTARVRIGNRTFTRFLKVETVKPNRLKIYLDFGKDVLSANDADNQGKLKVKWLHGAIAGELPARIDMSVSPRRTTFKGYSNYIFDDPLKDFSSDELTIFDGYVNEEGEAEFDPDLNIGNTAPGMLTAYFVTKVFEKGGGFSIDRYSMPYSPYKGFVGLSAPDGDLEYGTYETDKDIRMDVVTLNDLGAPVSRQNVQVNVYKVEWRWWWDSYDNDLASYIARPGTVPAYKTTLSTQRGKGSFSFKVGRADWGRYVVHVTDPETGHSTGKIIYVDWPYWARSERTSIENATMLSFSTDKETYTVGETANVSFPSGSKGRAIITLESGIKVVEKFEIQTQKGETTFNFKITENMAPNVYIHITLLQPHNVTENDLPIRMYGVAPIMVENPGTHLKPQLIMADVLRPETRANIAVREESGKEMTYTLAIVDEGLLDLTGFKTPDPWNHFYAREALGVKTWDVYDEVMGAFTVELNKLLAVGGDGTGETKRPTKANRFKPMVRFIGPFHLSPGMTKNHSIDIPNYIGSVRVMVVTGQDGRYGKTEKTVPVRSPLMILGTLPRVVGPTERVFLPVNVFAMEDQVKNVNVEIKTNSKFKVLGSSRKAVRFVKPGDEVINFELEVDKSIGIGKVEIVAHSGSLTAKHEIEIDVRTPNPPVSDVQEYVIDPGKSWDAKVKFTGIAGTNSAVMELSSFPPMNLDQRLKYLIRYPHGCIEQTTSAAFPQLALNQVMNLDNDFKIRIDQNIRAGLQRLRLFQTAEGGFSYWPGESQDDEWGTTYAGHFMLEAETRGYHLPGGMKPKWVAYQKSLARRYQPSQTGTYHYSSNNLVQAYRLYTLALAGAPELGSMNRLRELPNLTNAVKWRLAAAYKLAGQTEVAEKLVKGTSMEIDDYVARSYTYGSGLRDEAMVLETLVILNDRSNAAFMAKNIAKRMNSDQWMSTQTTAYCLIAISRFMGEMSPSKTMKLSYTVNGKNQISKSTGIPVYQADLKGLTGEDRVHISNNGDGLIYARLIVEGTPVIGDNTSSASNLSLSVDYMDTEGNGINPARLKQGTDFVARVTINNPGSRGDLEELALTQIFPSGWEIHNIRMDQNTSSLNNSPFDYQDIRDDRVYTYFSAGSGSQHIYEVKLNATYRGRFYLPTVACEAMYDNAVNARKPGMWVEVVGENDVAEGQ